MREWTLIIGGNPESMQIQGCVMVPTEFCNQKFEEHCRVPMIPSCSSKAAIGTSVPAKPHEPLLYEEP
jgi:hypothetical protein